MGEPAPVRGGAGGAGERVDSPQLLLAQLGQSHAARKRHRSQVSANSQMWTSVSFRRFVLLICTKVKTLFKSTATTFFYGGVSYMRAPV